MFIIKFKKIFIAIASVLVLSSLFCVIYFGLPLGIDFKGGSALEVQYENEIPNITEIQNSVYELGFEEVLVQPVGESGVVIKMKEITEEKKNQVLEKLGDVEQISFTNIGPSVGTELKNKAIISVVLVLFIIVLFIAYAFRKVSKPVSSWKFGLATIIALMHDIVIPLGVFAISAHIYGFELDTLSIVAILTTLALSISDTIVVFDRIREKLGAGVNMNFEELVGKSLSETFVRSMNTSLLSLVTIVALAIWGPESTRFFAFILSVGVFFGIYSSLFLASPLLVLMQSKNK